MGSGRLVCQLSPSHVFPGPGVLVSGGGSGSGSGSGSVSLASCGDSYLSPSQDSISRVSCDRSPKGDHTLGVGTHVI